MLNENQVQKLTSKQLDASALGKFLVESKIDPARIVGVGVNTSGVAHVIYAEGALTPNEEVKLEGSFLPGMYYLSAILKTSFGLIAEGARELMGLRPFSGVVHAIAETVLGKTSNDLFFVTPVDTQIATFVRSSSGLWTRCFADGIDAFGIRSLSQGGYVAVRGRGIIYIGDAALKTAFSGAPIEVNAFTAVKLQGTARGEFLSPITRVGRMRSNTIIVQLREGQSEIVSLQRLTPAHIHGEVMMALDVGTEVIGVATQTDLLAIFKTNAGGNLQLAYIPTTQASAYKAYIGV